MTVMTRIGLFILVIFPLAAEASMRCSGGIVDERATAFEVVHKCGEPDSKQADSPVVGIDGRVPDNAVTVERWEYGPDNGSYKQLRFIDGLLVEIKTRRL